MNKKKNDVFDIFEKSGYFILFLIGITVVFTSILLFCHVSVGWYNLCVGYIGAWMLFFFFYRERNKNELVKAGMLGTGIIGLAIAMNAFIQEIAYDGNLYHKLATGLLKMGWNPIYDNIKVYLELLNIPNNRVSSSDIWVACYPKAAWYFDSSVYALTNNIESAKIFNLLILYSVIGINFRFFSKKLKKSNAAILSIFMTLIPAGCSQIFTYYVDGALAALLLASAILLISLSEEQNLSERKKLFFCLAICIILCSNLKITGLAFEAVLCGLFFVYWCILIAKKQWMGKEWIAKWIIYYTIVVIIAVCVVGYGAYICNIINYGHPLYPMFGSDMLNVSNSLKNVGLDKATPIVQILAMLFVKTSNSDNIPVLEWKIPFTFEISEFYKCAQDTIRGGSGVFFSGILCISLIMLLYFVLRTYKDEKKEYIPIFLVMIYAFIMLCIMPAGGQARYSPYLYYIPYFTIYLWLRDLELNGSRYGIRKGIINVMFFLISINSFAFFSYGVRGIVESKKYEIQYCEMRSSDKVEIDTILPGVVFNLIDRNINYEYQTKYELTDGKMDYLFFTYNLNKE